MRKTQVHTESPSAVINLTPLVDMVFILLIFFMVTSSFVKETGVEVSRPSAQTAVRQEQASIVVAVTESGEVWIDKQRVDARAVGAHIERLRAENPEGSVVIVADTKAHTGVVVRVLDQARLAGAENVALAAAAPETR